MVTLDSDTVRARFTRARVGRLGTVTPAGDPHLVPCCFAVVAETVVSVVDGKPKSTGQLRRLENIRARPAASLLVDHYDDDWTRLWWVRVDGSARVIAPGDPGEEYTTAIDALAAKYRPYRDQRPSGALVVIDIARISGWAYEGSSDRPTGGPSTP